MRDFRCEACANKVYFENVRCARCDGALGFDVEKMAIVTLSASAPPKTIPPVGASAGSEAARYCANARHEVCNWLTSPGQSHGLCLACGLNRTIPNLDEHGSLAAWRDLERAKKRLVYSLARFGLSLDAPTAGAGRMTFDFVRGIATGHLDGVITVDIMETDSVERERQRQLFREPFRSLLGHLRHESGHFYCMTIFSGIGDLEGFRALFGDERQSYAQAVADHSAHGPPPDWQSRHLSAYASAHPWEDWAETWSHYLHMVDAVDTAEAVGMEPRSAGLALGAAWPFALSDVYRSGSFAALMERWMPLAIAMNSLSRSMGHDDYYPIVIPPPAHEKLAFVHRAIRAMAAPKATRADSVRPAPARKTDRPR